MKTKEIIEQHTIKTLEKLGVQKKDINVWLVTYAELVALELDFSSSFIHFRE